MSNTDKGNAKRASRPTLELARVLSDGEWYNTLYLSLSVGKYIRPELVSRRARQHRQKDMNAGRYQWVLAKLRYWSKVGKVEKRIEDGVTEWRAKNKEWVGIYIEWLENGLDKSYFG